MTSYLTTSQAEDRLAGRYNIDATLYPGDLDVASEELDTFGPFISYKKDSAQERAFPRSYNLDGTDNTLGTVPDAVLDAVALLAYHTSVNDYVTVTSESTLDMSKTFGVPLVNPQLSRAMALIKPYQLKVGRRYGERGYPYLVEDPDR